MFDQGFPSNSLQIFFSPPCFSCNQVTICNSSSTASAAAAASTTIFAQKLSAIHQRVSDNRNTSWPRAQNLPDGEPDKNAEGFPSDIHLITGPSTVSIVSKQRADNKRLLRAGLHIKADKEHFVPIDEAQQSLTAQVRQDQAAANKVSFTSFSSTAMHIINCNLWGC